MKQTHLIIFSMIFALNGCSPYNATDLLVEVDKNVKEQQQYFTTDKTMAKTFEAYEFLGEGDCDDYLINGADYNTVQATRDFYTRLCDTKYFARQVKDELGRKALSKIKTVQFLADSDNELRLSDKDTHCLSLKCDYNSVYDSDTQKESFKLTHGKWFYNDAECTERRRSILDNRNITMRCTFDYRDYIPEYAKIGTYDNFLKLYKAYRTDINQCGQKENFENTSTEYDECIKSVDDKMQIIIKSGVLK